MLAQERKSRVGLEACSEEDQAPGAWEQLDSDSQSFSEYVLYPGSSSRACGCPPRGVKVGPCLQTLAVLGLVRLQL